MHTRTSIKRANRSSLSPKELAAAIGVSESSVKRWVDDGLLEATRTAGGHRRIPLAEAVRFVRRAGLSVADPQALGLGITQPLAAAGKEEYETERLTSALVEDRSGEARSLIVSWFVGGATLGWIFDGPVRKSLETIGELWQHGPEGIVVEHRAVETCVRALAELRSLLPRPGDDAPVAVGGGYAGDDYTLPSAMVALVLAEVGYRTRNLGPNTPMEATVAAIDRYRPAVVWQCFSIPPRSTREARAALDRIAEAISWGTLVYGGRGSVNLPASSHPRIHRIDAMTELAGFARGALAKPRP